MITLTDVHFRYEKSAFSLHIPSLCIRSGEKVAFVGPSGSGKTTLIHLIAGIVRARSGRILIDDFELTRQGDAGLRNFRISTIGFIFQEFELLDYLNVRENILLPYFVNPLLKLTHEVKEDVIALATSVGLGDKLPRYLNELSQGERQRVAICRALITKPSLIIADEPTGNLDDATTRNMVDRILRQADQCRATLIMVTHNTAMLDLFDRAVHVSDFSGAGAP